MYNFYTMRIFLFLWDDTDIFDPSTSFSKQSFVSVFMCI